MVLYNEVCPVGQRDLVAKTQKLNIVLKLFTQFCVLALLRSQVRTLGVTIPV